jgi:hypothetical protein
VHFFGVVLGVGQVGRREGREEEMCAEAHMSVCTDTTRVSHLFGEPLVELLRRHARVLGDEPAAGVCIT